MTIAVISAKQVLSSILYAPLPHSLLLPLHPQAVYAPSLLFSEGHSLILVSINADLVTHWPESFSSDIGTQSRHSEKVVCWGLIGQGQGPGVLLPLG